MPSAAAARGPRTSGFLDPKRRIVLLKVAVWAAGLAPVAWLTAGLFADTLGVDPIQVVIHVEGRSALVFLLATLAVTPVRRLTGWNRVIRLRRLLGLFAFFHACVHFLCYAGLDKLFALGAILDDVVERRYITAGFAALVLMVPLAVTSTRGWIRRLGKRWQQLHRLAYVAAGLGVLHYFWKVRADTFWPLVSAVVLAGLLAVRLVHRRGKRAPGARKRGPRATKREPG